MGGVPFEHTAETAALAVQTVSLCTRPASAEPGSGIERFIGQSVPKIKCWVVLYTLNTIRAGVVVIQWTICHLCLIKLTNIILLQNVLY